MHTHTHTNDAHPRSFRGLTPASTYCTHPGRGLGEGSSGYSSAVLRCFYSSDEMSRMAADGLQVHSAWRDYLKLASPEAQLSRVRSARGAAALTGCKADRRRLPCSLYGALVERKRGPTYATQCNAQLTRRPPCCPHKPSDRHQMSLTQPTAPSPFPPSAPRNGFTTPVSCCPSGRAENGACLSLAPARVAAASPNTHPP